MVLLSWGQAVSKSGRKWEGLIGTVYAMRLGRKKPPFLWGLDSFARGGHSSPQARPQKAFPVVSIVKVSYTHDAMIDLIVADPSVSQGAIAAHFGYSEGWISQVFTSDLFLKRLQERKAELVDPALRASIEKRLEGLAHLSLNIVMEKLEATRSGAYAMEALELSTKSLGYGARHAAAPVQQNFVVVLPEKAQDSESWARQHALPHNA